MMLLVLWVAIATADVIRREGICKVVREAKLRIVDDVCMMNGKIVFSAGAGESTPLGNFDALIEINGECTTYAWLFNRHSESTPCVHVIGAGNGVNGGDLEDPGHWMRNEVNRVMRSVSVYQLASDAFAWVVSWVYFIFAEAPLRAVNTIGSMIGVSSYQWVWIDLSLAACLIAAVVYVFGYRFPSKLAYGGLPQLKKVKDDYPDDSRLPEISPPPVDASVVTTTAVSPSINSTNTGNAYDFPDPPWKSGAEYPIGTGGGSLFKFRTGTGSEAKRDEVSS
jgi:hypothetical protein